MDLTGCPLERLAALMLRVNRKSPTLYNDLKGDLHAWRKKQTDAEQSSPIGLPMLADDTAREMAAILNAPRELIRPAVDAAITWRWSGLRRILDKYERFLDTGKWHASEENTATPTPLPHGGMTTAARALPAERSGAGRE